MGLGVSVPACITGHMTGGSLSGESLSRGVFVSVSVRETPEQRPPCHTIKSERYVSYWNAFLFSLKLKKNDRGGGRRRKGVWRIYIVKFWRTPLSVQSSLSCICLTNRLAPLLRFETPPPLENMDPPLMWAWDSSTEINIQQSCSSDWNVTALFTKPAASWFTAIPLVCLV